jgi:hypothetical protein
LATRRRKFKPSAGRGDLQSDVSDQNKEYILVSKGRLHLFESQLVGKKMNVCVGGTHMQVEIGGGQYDSVAETW